LRARHLGQRRSAERPAGEWRVEHRGTVALESIAASIIAGESLRGGIGRVENVVLGAIFIVLVQNGMNVAGVGLSADGRARTH
jgi:ABC-type xylose transport system permease subunit